MALVPRGVNVSSYSAVLMSLVTLRWWRYYGQWAVVRAVGGVTGGVRMVRCVTFLRNCNILEIFRRC